jgi:uncharacterized membrane protein YkvA (DUF1232 family)
VKLLKTVLRRGARHPGATLTLLWNLPKLVRLHFRLLQDPRVPLGARLLFVAALIYVLSPLDFLPDFLAPLLGWADDLVILIAASSNLLASVPKEVFRQHLEALS